MEIEELMINDWVQVPSELNRYKKIRSTFDLDSAILYRPIPLTEKILKDNGFVYYHKNIASLSPEHPFKLEMIEWPDENGLGGTWTVNGFIKIRFVHELQNIMKIAGIDKKIEL